MEIQIRKNAYVSTLGYGRGVRDAQKTMKDFVEAHGGEWVKVDTDNLFNNQYSLLNHPYTLNDSMVSAVRDDVRQGIGKCRYCGSIVREGEECTKYASKGMSLINSALNREDNQKTKCSEYGVEWFTEKNTPFIAHPDGFPAVPKISMDDEHKNGSFRLEQLSGSLNYYRLKNARETFCFLYRDGFFYMQSGKRYKNLPIKASTFSNTKLKAYLETQV